jgi:fucose permease
MATRTENATVNVVGLVQGITLVTFPAASSVLTRKTGFGLSSSQYGDMFLPQVATAVAASLLGTALARRITTKRVLLLGIGANIVSMALLVASSVIKTDPSAYTLLLVATAFLGAGFGLTVPVVNTYVAVFNPAKVDRSVLVLNALLGLGTALAPVFVAAFDSLGFWWGLPLLSVVLFSILLMVSIRLPLQSAATSAADAHPGKSPIPTRFWVFAGFAVLYGICETMNGNWSQLQMTTERGASSAQASLALTAFWAMVTAGRVIFAGIGRWVPTRVTYHVLPFVLVATFSLTAVLPSNSAGLSIAVFALAGLGCSALLPLSISFGQEDLDLASMSAAMAGGVIAFYQLGYGVAAFGVGPLRAAGLSLSTIFGVTALVALAMGSLSFAVTHRRPSPARLHPLPALSPVPN